MPNDVGCDAHPRAVLRSDDDLWQKPEAHPGVYTLFDGFVPGPYIPTLPLIALCVDNALRSRNELG
jgi:hypothetical protein